MSAVELAAVAKRFSNTVVLTDIDLTVADGSLTAILGASGSGKTTLLRLIAGFDRVDVGTVTIGGRIVDDGGRAFVSPQRRGVGYVPQDGALFPHLTVLGNIGFGLARRDRARAGELVDLVGLSGFGARYPHQLSGGQQQRVALARALAIQPKVVLLDEPFSALDASLRVSLRRDVGRILADTGTTTILVTHDQDEALALADQVAVLDDGHVLAAAGPRELYRHPPDAAAALSIGEANLLAGTRRDGDVDTALGVVTLDAADASLDARGTGVRVLLRPEQLDVQVTSPGEPPGVTATVEEVQYHGHDALVTLRVEPGGDVVVARVPGNLELCTSQQVWLRVNGTARAWPIVTPSPVDG